MQKIKCFAFYLLCIYGAYIGITMFMWDCCWINSRNSLSPSINWLLIAFGVSAQILHMVILFSICNWLINRNISKSLNYLLIKKAIGERLIIISLSLVMTVLASSMVAHGLLYGNSMGYRVLSDTCWDWTIAWNCKPCNSGIQVPL